MLKKLVILLICQYSAMLMAKAPLKAEGNSREGPRSKSNCHFRANDNERNSGRWFPSNASIYR